MIETSVIWQSLAATTAIGTTSAGLYYVYTNSSLNNDVEDKTQDSFSPDNNNKTILLPDIYYIAQLKTKTENGQMPSKEMYEAETRNFSCKFSINSEEKKTMIVIFLNHKLKLLRMNL